MVDKTDHDEDIDVETKTHETEGSLLGGWPAILLTIAMVSAAVYAFSPRPHPPVPPTQIKANQLMTNGLAQQGTRLLAVGELGRILYADNPNGPWSEAKVEPQRGANLTKVQFIEKNVALAVGHSGWLLRSEDGGKTWKELAFTENSSDPLLGIGGPFKGKAAGKLFAFGAFGQFLTSTDGGRSWRKEELSVLEAEVPEESAQAEESTGEAADDDPLAAADDDPFGMGDDDPFGGGDDDYDPFADFESGGMTADFGSRHMYGMTETPDGSLFLVGERGMILRSEDGGANWLPLDEIYTGSFYGITPTPEGLLVYGMRGNAFFSSDLGTSWQPSKIPLKQGLYASAVDSSGMVILAGASNTVLVSRDGGRSFTRTTQRGPSSFASVIPLQQGGWLFAGEGGVGKRSIFRPVSASSGGQS